MTSILSLSTKLDSTMSTYQYTQLPTGCIRILRLQPHQDKQSAIRCQLSDLELRSSEGLCPYEALSYVWGSPDKPHTIDIDGYSLSVGANLYAALLSLRYTSLERILWVDALCIDQTNITEKEQQIQLMAEIYAKARSVIIWLGEATTAATEDALEEIRDAAAGTSNGVEISVPEEEPILEILKLPWFKRVWVGFVCRYVMEERTNTVALGTSRSSCGATRHSQARSRGNRWICFLHRP